MGLKGRFIGIDGSVGKDADVELVRRCHKAIRQLTRGILKSGGGVVVSAGSEECLVDGDPNTARVFYWTVLDEVHRFMLERGAVGESTERPSAIIVCSQKLRGKVPPHRDAQLRDLLKEDAAKLKLLKVNWNTGAYIREHQVREGDALVILGGGEGVEHLASLYVERNRPVIPLDPKIGSFFSDGNGGAERLHRYALEKPQKFVEREPERFTGALDLLSLQRNDADPDQVGDGIVQLLERVIQPRVFFIRLLNPTVNEYLEVENFFNDVVTPCVERLGYRADQIGLHPGTEAFLNREIFERLHNSAAVIADLTSLRPNNFLEMGYALGRPLKTLITAMDGTSLPFDSQAMSVHFWKARQPTTERQRLFIEFWEKNIGRPPLVLPRELD